MGSFGELAVEVQELILSGLQDNPQMPAVFLCNANLVCRQWHEIATRLLFKSVTLVAAHHNRKQEAYFNFLISNKHILSAIRSISIVITRMSIAEPWQQNIQKLISLSGYLKEIKILSGSELLLREHYPENHEGTNYNSMNQLRCLIPTWLDQFGLKVSIDLDRYVHTMDCGSMQNSIMGGDMSSRNTQYQRYHTLRSFSVSLLQPHQRDLSDWPDIHSSWPRRYPGCASQEVAVLLNAQPDLESFALELSPEAEWTSLKATYEEEKKVALKNIVPTQRNLSSLSIHGDLAMSDEAWDKWRLITWSQITSLTLVHPTLVASMIARLGDICLRSLRTLKVMNYKSVESIEDPIMEPPNIRDLLNSINVNELSLVGVKPETLMESLSDEPHLGETLDKLRFHHPNSVYVTTMEQITQLKALVNVSWLGLDMHRRHLFGTSHPDAHLLYLDALAEMRALKQLRIFVHDEPFLLDRMAETEFTKADAIASFRYLDVQKLGSPLESLVICQGRGLFSELWIVWHLGGTQVMLDHRNKEIGRQVEIWNLDTLTRIKDYPAHWTDWGAPDMEWRSDPLWGLPEGW